jgi:hypothetical protein
MDDVIPARQLLAEVFKGFQAKVRRSRADFGCKRDSGDARCLQRALLIRRQPIDLGFDHSA